MFFHEFGLLSSPFKLFIFFKEKSGKYSYFPYSNYRLFTHVSTGGGGGNKNSSFDVYTLFGYLQIILPKYFSLAVKNLCSVFPSRYILILMYTTTLLPYTVGVLL